MKKKQEDWPGQNDGVSAMAGDNYRPKKEHPITTKAGKRQFIKQLSKNMERKFLDKLDHVPDNWDGIEIRAWMATTWQAENPFPKGYTARSGYANNRARAFKNDLITRPL